MLIKIQLAVLQDFITDIEQNLRRTEQEQSVILAREKYEVDKVLEIDDKVKEKIRVFALLFRCGFKQLFQSLDFFIKIDQWIL
jgi:hypothetical protein